MSTNEKKQVGDSASAGLVYGLEHMLENARALESRLRDVVNRLDSECVPPVEDPVDKDVRAGFFPAAREIMRRTEDVHKRTHELANILLNLL